MVDTAQLRPGDRVPISWNEYEALGEFKGEYIDGELVVSPAVTLRHQRIQLALLLAIGEVLPAGTGVIHDWGWKPRDDEFIPDVMVFNDAGEDQRLTGMPHLIIEILSSDPARDLIRKLAKYSELGLERYWVVDPDGPEIIVFGRVGERLTEQTRHRTAAELDVGPATVEIDPASLIE